MEIEGYTNYLIYKDGRIWSKKSNKYLKPCLNGRGYLRHCLYNDNGKIKTRPVHRLVALAYIPNPENRVEIDHINREKTDNRVENLAWATSSENNVNTAVYKTNKLGIKNISKLPDNNYIIRINRYKRVYYKHCKTLEEAIVQRDLMLSMFNY